jgi:acyl dehydratase
MGMNKKQWNDAKIGEDLGTRTYRLSPEEVARYIQAVDDHNPWYTSQSPFGGPIAPPLILGNEYMNLYREQYDVTYLLNSKMEVEVFQPPRVGSVISTSVRIVDKFIKKERKTLVIEARSRDEEGREISVYTMTLVYLN